MSTITVSHGSDSDYKSIQAAVDNAYNGDEIIIKQGIYNENVSIHGKTITIRGENDVVVENNSKDIFSLKNSDSVIDNITIKQKALGVWDFPIDICGRRPTIKNCKIYGGTSSCIGIAMG